MTTAVVNICDNLQVHPFMEDCLRKVVPPSWLQKELIFGEETRVAALSCALNLVSFWDLFGTDVPPASVSLGICHVKKSCLR